ncbi:MAG: dUTP diphosphatase [Patescibacteria group bacterium]
MKMVVKIKRISRDAKIPTYAHPGDAGMDLYACENMVIKKGDTTLVPTGIAVEIPEGYVGLIWDKSGLANKHKLKSLGGVVDAGYRGEIQVGLFNLGTEDYVVENHHKIAQLLIQKIERAELEEVDELPNSSRGDKGFGSTGKQ